MIKKTLATIKKVRTLFTANPKNHSSQPKKETIEFIVLKSQEQAERLCQKKRLRKRGVNYMRYTDKGTCRINLPIQHVKAHSTSKSFTSLDEKNAP